MRHIQGSTADEKFQSIDSILDKVVSKNEMLVNKLSKQDSSMKIPFLINSYADTCNVSGDVICASLSLVDAEITDATLVIDDYSKDKDLWAVVSVTSEGVEKIAKVKVKVGVNEIKETERVRKGDKVKVSLEYPDENIRPKGIWVAIKGVQE